MDENALVSQPWVGMIDGVAASRCEWLAEAVGLASPNDEASRLARRISAFRSTRISCGAPDRRSRVQQSRTGRQCGSADAGRLDLGIDGLEVGQHPDAGVALADAGDGVRQVERRPFSSPISWASRAFSCCSLGRAREVRRAGQGRVPDEQRRGQAEGRAADCRLDQRRRRPR